MFKIQPRQLAELLDNAVDISKDSGKLEVTDKVALRLGGGLLFSYGRGRYTAGRDCRPVDTEEEGWLVLTKEKAAALAKALKDAEGSNLVGSRVDVQLDSREGIALTYNGDPMADLGDDDPDDETFEAGWWEQLDTYFEEADLSWDVPKGFTLRREVWTKLNKIRPGGDAARFTAINGYTVLIRMGEHFMGFAETLREEAPDGE